ncbi:MAG: tRNA (adenosine(37)-N6)-dimethylallyltransferase MiaA [Coriobacteriia bacterium]|nr:tRNA (adenosine(37)-N6)-dimethylallyltransferase MiaA [Coriobacteriia bacterium]
MHKTPVIAIVGPTGVGKSEVAQLLAKSMGSSVLSADSMQVYRGMDIGTAKLLPSQRVVPHYGLDLVDPSEVFTAAAYQSYAREVIERLEVSAEGLPPVVCGGTGLYLRAALDDFDFADGSATSSDTTATAASAQLSQEQQDLRESYERLHEQIGTEKLHDLLAARDARSAAAIHPNNVRRVIRALELAEAGQCYADIKSAFKQRRSHYPTLWVGLTRDRAELYDHINSRVDQMMGQGLLREVDALLQRGYRDALTAAAAIGYKELVPVIDAHGVDESTWTDEARLEFAAAVEDIKQASRRYAKRQLSWFRADARVHWIDVDNMTAEEVVARVLKLRDAYNSNCQLKSSKEQT